MNEAQAAQFGFPTSDLLIEDGELRTSYASFIKALNASSDGNAIWLPTFEELASNPSGGTLKLLSLLTCATSQGRSWLRGFARENEQSAAPLLLRTFKALAGTNAVRQFLNAVPPSKKRTIIGILGEIASFGMSWSVSAMALPFSRDWTCIIDDSESVRMEGGDGPGFLLLGFARREPLARAFAQVLIRTTGSLRSLPDSCYSNDFIDYEKELIRLCWGQDKSEKVVGSRLLIYPDHELAAVYNEIGELASLAQADANLESQLEDLATIGRERRTETPENLDIPILAAALNVLPSTLFDILRTQAEKALRMETRLRRAS